MVLFVFCSVVETGLRVTLYVLSGTALLVAANLALRPDSPHRWVLAAALTGYVSTLALLVAWRTTKYAGDTWE